MILSFRFFTLFLSVFTCFNSFFQISFNSLDKLHYFSSSIHLTVTLLINNFSFFLNFLPFGCIFSTLYLISLLLWNKTWVFFGDYAGVSQHCLCIYLFKTFFMNYQLSSINWNPQTISVAQFFILLLLFSLSLENIAMLLRFPICFSLKCYLSFSHNKDFLSVCLKFYASQSLKTNMPFCPLGLFRRKAHWFFSVGNSNHTIHFFMGV